MTFGQFLSILRARWKIALTVFLATVVLTLIVSLLLPKQYTASASVVVDIKPDPIAGMAYSMAVAPAYVATQVDVISSDRVALKVVRMLKLADNPQVQEQWRDETDGQGSIEVWLAEALQKKLSVKPSRDSNVVNVDFTAPDPKFAAGVANTFVQAYLDTALELRVDPAKQYSSFFDSRVKDARAALEAAQAKLSAFQKEKGIIATDERVDVESMRLNELSAQLVNLQTLSAESGSRQTLATGTTADKMQEVLNNPVIAGLKADLSRSEAKLQELNSRLGENHPQVIEAKASISELRARIDAETRRVSSGVGVTNTINRQREAEIRAALEAQRARVLQMRQLRDESTVLLRDVDNAQRTYDALIARLNQTSLESQTTQSNVTFLTHAVAPVKHSWPKVPLNAALSVLVGLLLAVAVGLVLELMDRRVRTDGDIYQMLGVPMLGVMPKPSSKGGNRRMALLMQQRVIGQLPMAK